MDIPEAPKATASGWRIITTNLARSPKAFRSHRRWKRFAGDFSRSTGTLSRRFRGGSPRVQCSSQASRSRGADARGSGLDVSSVQWKASSRANLPTPPKASSVGTTAWRCWPSSSGASVSWKPATSGDSFITDVKIVVPLLCNPPTKRRGRRAQADGLKPPKDASPSLSSASSESSSESDDALDSAASISLRASYAACSAGRMASSRASRFS